MSSELVEALREQVPIKTPISVCRLLDRAADRIEALEAENARLLDILKDFVSEFGVACSEDVRVSVVSRYIRDHPHSILARSIDAINEAARRAREGGNADG